jgi:Homeobox KN domain/C-terminal domain of homeodomain 1
LNNLHNPYPSKESRASIAQETDTSFKDVDNWFINVRKRIGWNKLRMKRYSNKRSKIVDAATRFFKEIPQASHHGPYSTHISDIDLTVNHDSEFKVIENCVKELYSDKLFESLLTTKLDGAVGDLMPQMMARGQAEEEHPRQVVKSRRRKDLQRPSAYPSPEPSPEPLTASSLPIVDAARTISCKRRNSDRDSPDLDFEDRRDKPQKRSRYFLSINNNFNYD